MLIFCGLIVEEKDFYLYAPRYHYVLFLNIFIRFRYFLKLRNEINVYYENNVLYLCPI